MELVFILIIALVVLGPERLPQVAREITKLIRQMREIYAEIAGTLQKEFGDLEEFKEIQELSDSLRKPLNLNDIGKPSQKSSAKSGAKPATSSSTQSAAVSVENSKPLAQPLAPSAPTSAKNDTMSDTMSDTPQNGTAPDDAQEENRIAPPSMDVPGEDATSDADASADKGGETPKGANDVSTAADNAPLSESAGKKTVEDDA